MDKYLCCSVFVVILILHTGLIKGFRLSIDSGTIQNDVRHMDETGNSVGLGRHLLATSDNTTTTAPPPQEKDLITRINEFYADKNNMAMFCVLPIMIVVYGGCSVIYCIAKLRRYIRRKQTRAAAREDRERLNNEDQNDDFCNLPNGPPQPGIPPPVPPKPFSPPPWSVQKEREVEAMVPPISSHHPAKPQPLATRNEGRRDYKDLLRVKAVNENEAFEDDDRPRIREAYRMKGPDEISGRESVASYKDELLARFDALSTFTMSRKAATILRTGTNNKKKAENEKEEDLFNGKPRQKMIFITE